MSKKVVSKKVKRHLGHWLVKSRGGKDRRFKTDKELVACLRKNCGCMVTWINLNA